jgi:hypothetical protein
MADPKEQSMTDTAAPATGDEIRYRQRLTAAMEEIHRRLRASERLDRSASRDHVAALAANVAALTDAVHEAETMSAALAELPAPSRDALRISGSTDAALLLIRRALRELESDLAARR